jgi:small subunit ribosomal protein S3
MGQKVNPIGLRLGINRTWDSRWFAARARLRQAAARGHAIREVLMMKQLKQAGVSKHRHRASAQEVPRHDPLRPSGRGDRQEGRGHREAAQAASKMTERSVINIVEIRKPEIDARWSPIRSPSSSSAASRSAAP